MSLGLLHLGREPNVIFSETSWLCSTCISFDITYLGLVRILKQLREFLGLREYYYSEKVDLNYLPEKGLKSHLTHL